MQEEVDGETRDEMVSKEGGFHTTKAVHYLLDALRYFKDNAGLEQGKYLFLEEACKAAIGPYIWIYAQGMKRGREVAEKECFLTYEEYRELMGEGEGENDG